ncbi:MAG TPA: UDP-N-acetylmuramate--L-alanine ligase [Candidatus Paceibacterota bacterium]|nr:UDP-N-acetylmuramate--L-alanine ligase [Candidatus Paceibacterota bacterium]
MSASSKLSKNKPSSLRVHFIGIGGIGMSGLARYFLAHKWAVSGSDAVRSPLTDELIKEGVKVKIGHKKGNIPGGTHLVIYNRAILPANPELAAAEVMAQRKQKVVLPYSKALGRITEDYQTIAITGSHGKSTTTALAGLALMRAGLDPTILVGTKLVDLGGKNIRVGHGSYLVLEADDFHAAFLDYSPAVAIVTNIDREHMDFYKTFGNAKRAFLKFLARTRRGGTLILNRDDAPLYSLRAAVARMAKKRRLKVVWFSVRGDAANVSLTQKVKKIIPIAGEHNVSNAMAVLQLGKTLKIPEKKILDAIGSYKGAWRRMELKGRLKNTKIPVYDDYAHHPTEIRATLAAFREKFPRSPIVCVFQPHQAKRLELLFKDFTAAFDAADIVFILPLYKVLGRDEKFSHDSAALVKALALRAPAKPVFYLQRPNDIRRAVTTVIRDVPLKKNFPRPPVVVMMGAGDISDLTGKLLK